MIPYGRQHITPQDEAAVLEVLRSDWLTQGPTIERFERELARLADAQHAVAVNSATSALHIACLALGLGPGDRLWTSPNTFVASANCARYCGADVDFVDVDARSYNMCAQALAVKLEQAQRQGTLPKIVLPVHFAGQSADMQAIHALSLRYGFRIIEDASHAVGASYQGHPVGSARHSDIVVFSFHPVKIITTAEGGCALTNDAALARRMALLRSHGITRDAASMPLPSDGPWAYQQIDLGFNYRMTDLQAALGLAQATRLHDFVERRHALARRYDTLLAGLPVVTPWQDPAGRSALHLYPIQVDDAAGGRTAAPGLRCDACGRHRRQRALHPGPYAALLPRARLPSGRFSGRRVVLRACHQLADVRRLERQPTGHRGRSPGRGIHVVVGPPPTKSGRSLPCNRPHSVCAMRSALAAAS